MDTFCIFNFYFGPSEFGVSAVILGGHYFRSEWSECASGSNLGGQYFGPSEVCNLNGPNFAIFGLGKLHLLPFGDAGRM